MFIEVSRGNRHYLINVNRIDYVSVLTLTSDECEKASEIEGCSSWSNRAEIFLSDGSRIAPDQDYLDIMFAIESVLNFEIRDLKEPKKFFNEIAP